MVMRSIASFHFQILQQHSFLANNTNAVPVTAAASENMVSFTFASVTTPPFILVTLVIDVAGEVDQARFPFFRCLP